MRRRQGVIILLMLTLLLGFNVTTASALLFDLNCVLSHTGCTAGPTFGTLSITDNGMMVNLNVDLVNTISGSPHKVLAVYLNFNNFPITGKLDTVSPVGIITKENKLKADGYLGYFDLKLPDPPPGNLGFEPYSDTIKLTGFDLDPSYFDSLDTLGSIYAAVHIGNYGNAPGVGGGNSIWVGGTKSTPPAVPEPGTLMLLGSGLFGTGIFGRKLFRKQSVAEETK